MSTPPAHSTPDDLRPVPPGTPSDPGRVIVENTDCPRVVDTDSAAMDELLCGVLANLPEPDVVTDPALGRILRGVRSHLGDPTLLNPRAKRAVLQLPAKFGAYRVVGEKGRGGMGVVYEAIDDELHRPVAVKVLDTTRVTTPDAKARFQREARAAAAITHDNVVPIYHVGEADGVPFIVMPMLQGESLESRREREKMLLVDDAIRIGREIAAGLAAAHAKGLIHRDIKPPNIWLEAPSGRVKILDFGLARPVDGSDGLTSIGMSPGTPGYMSPEQAEGQSVDARSDLFNLGATLYVCLTGRPAFDGLSAAARWAAVLRSTPPPPHEVNPAVPVPLSNLVIRLLARDPAARPSSAQAVADELARIAAGTAVPEVSTVWSNEDPLFQQPPRSWSKRPLQWAAVAAVGVALAAIAGWFLTREPEREVVQKPSIDPRPARAPDPVHYGGFVDILVTRKVKGNRTQLRLNSEGALPLQLNDQFKVLVEVEPASFVYVFWVEPDGSVALVYPWDPEKEGPRPAHEKPIGELRLPSVDEDFTITNDLGGVTTLVILARPTPLNVPDDVVKGWFADLPKLPLPEGEEKAAVWFDDYERVIDLPPSPGGKGGLGSPDPPRGGVLKRVESGDVFQRWQSALKKRVGDAASFQTAVSFARVGKK